MNLTSNTFSLDLEIDRINHSIFLTKKRMDELQKMIVRKLNVKNQYFFEYVHRNYGNISTQETKQLIMTYNLLEDSLKELQAVKSDLNKLHKVSEKMNVN